MPAAALGTIDRDATKARVLARLLAGWVATDVVDAAEDYAENVVTARLRADTVARVTWHRHQGHRLVIVSASPELYVGPAAAALGLDAALATRLEADDGRLTRQLAGATVRGPDKVHRLKAHSADGPM